MNDFRQRLVVFLIAILTAATLWLHFDITFKNYSRMETSHELRNLEERLKSVPSSYKVVGVESLYKIADEIKSLRSESVLVDRRWLHASTLLNVMIIALGSIWFISSRRKISQLGENSIPQNVDRPKVWDEVATGIIHDINAAASKIEAFSSDDAKNHHQREISRHHKESEHSILSAHAKAISVTASEMAQEILESQSMLRMLAENLQKENQFTTQNKIEWNLLATQLRSSKESLLLLVSNCHELTKKLNSFDQVIKACTQSEKHVAEQSIQVKGTIVNLAKNLNSLQSSSKEINHTIETCRADLKQSLEPIVALSSRTKEIAAIIGTIDDISEQTNLLAINASIEASRAGEQGQGFAVVAEEVRKLALKSSHATRNISELLLAIQSEASRAEDRLTNASVSANQAAEMLSSFNSQMSPSQEQAELVAAQSVKLAEICARQNKSAALAKIGHDEALSLASEISSKMTRFAQHDLPLLDKINDLASGADRLSRTILRHSFDIEKLEAGLEVTKFTAQEIAKQGTNLVIGLKTETPHQDNSPISDSGIPVSENREIINAARELSISASSLVDYGLKKKLPVKSSFDIDIKQIS